VLARCRRPVTVADLAADVDLPIGVVQVLLGDLTEHGMVRVVATPRGPVTNRQLLNAVLDGLKAL
jgi:DNA-binding IclR family transcriptional regulator